MHIWSKDHKDEFLRELLRHEGLGENWRNPTCGTCHQSLMPPSDLDPHTRNPRIIRCRDCFGGLQECIDCCLQRHARLPLHVLDVNSPTLPLTFVTDLILFTKEWTGEYWDRRTLKELGLIIQMGHNDTPCLNPAPTLTTTVLDHNGIHQVAVRFCNCERALLGDKRIQCLRAGWYPASVTDPQTCATFRVLEDFHLLNLTGGLNVHDYIGALERRTDGTRVTLAPVCP
jgi:hypothetical protein